VIKVQAQVSANFAMTAQALNCLDQRPPISSGGKGIELSILLFNYGQLRDILSATSVCTAHTWISYRYTFARSHCW